VVVARSGAAGEASALRGLDLELVGEDRAGIVSKITRILAERGVSIESLHTEIVSSAGASKPTARIRAHLLAPQGISAESLKQELGVLANEMMLDLALGERTGASTAR
jgi:glycine cleavage system regulatory protein